MGEEETSGRARIEAEAAEWLARLETGSADAGQFERWRAADPAHAAAFAQIDAAWARADRARALRPPGPSDPDLFAPARSEAPPSRRWLLRAAAIGGVAVVGAGAAGLLFSGRAYAETGVGERRTIRLPDGSLLELNTDSRASWRFTERARRLWLDRGEAALEVTSEDRPFLVNADDRGVALNRGVFNARRRIEGMEIVVLSGEAFVSGAEAPVPAGGVLLMSAQGSEVRRLTAAAVDSAAAWRRGEIIFDGDTLGVAVAEYNRYLTAKIEIGDPEIAQLRLGGRFTTHDPTAFLDSIEQAFGVRVERTGDGAVRLTSG